MKKIIIQKNKTTNKMTIKIISIVDIDVVGNLTFITNKNGCVCVIDGYDNKVIIQEYTTRNIKNALEVQYL